MSRWIYSVFFFTLAHLSWAQNLVPNPGFEDVTEEGVAVWVQPPEPYYHHEDSSQGDPHSGQHYNGLCMYNHDICEYMSVKLTEPMLAGQEYCLKFYIRLAEFKAVRFRLNDGIGILFSGKSGDVSRKLYRYEQPSVFARFHLMDDRFEWVEMQCNYIASGGEKYMTVGNFFPNGTDIPMTEEDKQAAEELNAAKERRDAELEKAMVEIEQKYPKIEINYSSDPYKKYSKKEMKMFEEQKRNIRLRAVEQREAANEIQVAYDREIQVIQEKYADRGLPYFYLRYYFDDFSVTPVPEGELCPCQEEIVLEEGATFTAKNILFETGKSDLLAASYAELNKLVNLLLEFENLKISLNGHTDNVGTAEDNLQLSMDRAQVVYQYLIEHGIASDRLKFKGFGDTEPVETNDTKAGRALNRRVEIQILSVE